MEKARILRLVLIPALVGLVVTLAARQWLEPPQIEAAAGPEMVSVVAVAGKEVVAARTRLTSQHLVLRQLPAEALIGTEFRSVEEVVGRFALVALEPGEVLLRSRIVDAAEGSLAYRLPSGTRAVTIHIDEFSGVAGHVAPGDAVDLVLIFPEKQPQRPAATATLLHQSVPVLGSGLAEGAEAGRLSSLTLALTPEAAVEVALAEQVGRIKVLLRPAAGEPATAPVIRDEHFYRSQQGGGTSGGR